MKKTGLFLLVGIIAVSFVTGCAISPVTRTANLKMTPDGGVSYDDRSIPIIQSPPGPVAVATGAAIITRANSEQEFNRALASLLKARAESIKNGVPSHGGSSKEFVGIVFNDSLTKVLHFEDPQLEKIYDVPIGGHKFFSADKLPKKISYWWSGDKKKRTARVKAEPDKYNEVPVDSVIRIKR